MSRSRSLDKNLTRTLTFEREAINEEERTVELSFSSEMPYERWFGSEILSHDSGAVDLSRLQEVGVLLFSHGRDARYGRMPIGTIVRVWIDEEQRKGKAIVKFDDDEDSDKVFRKVVKGIIKGVSVGYAVSAWEEVKAGKTSSNGRHTGPAYVAVKWQPFEISIEPTPADPSVGVGRSNSNEGEEETMNGLKRLALAQGFLVPDNGAPAGGSTSAVERTAAPAASNPIDPETLQRQAAEAERNRVAEITELCRNFGMEDELPEYIRSGVTVQAVKDAILEKQLQSRKPAAQQVIVQAEDTDKFRAAASDALLIRAGRHIQKPADGAWNCAACVCATSQSNVCNGSANPGCIDLTMMSS